LFGVADGNPKEGTDQKNQENTVMGPQSGKGGQGCKKRRGPKTANKSHQNASSEE